jgi:hypothetical protein
MNCYLIQNCAEVGRVIPADIVQMLRRQVHRLALAQQDRTGLALKQRLATGTAFLFMFAHSYRIIKLKSLNPPLTLL